jgi:hypothetical protein
MPKTTQPTPLITKKSRTHRVRGILVGAGIQQQTHTVRATIDSGHNQHRLSFL